MSFTSSTASSPSSSPRSMPMLIRSTSADTFQRSSSINAMYQHDFASSTLNKRSYAKTNSYISDEDLFGDGYLSEAPEPPRPAEAYLAQPLLPPVTKTRRTSSSHSKSKASRAHKVTFKT
ncbi:hypothetical protein LTR78_002013 [Recurvomyces mirabilis]|uniref:Uncharacterized protein n=1 Tax=Recurvomyces mirabilis TaxID=574656 RepID=A0AAE0WTT5_9PEZI|nr:hypothetical protein LTR78_002013 [Recurvomyces mirabilis]KAK5160471.1 hypothetical protein LTS14_001483 [Recurvomyces mirabilis]